MSVAQTAARLAKTAGNGVTVAFGFTWKIFSKTDLTCYKVSALGVYTLGVVDVDYTVSFDTAAETGTVTWTVAPVSGGFSVIIGDVMPLTQASNYPREGITPAATIKNTVDKLTVLVQQIRDKLSRAPLQPLTPVNPGAITVVAPIANKGLLWRDDGGGLFSIINSDDDLNGIVAAAQAAAAAAAASASAATASASAAASSASAAASSASSASTSAASAATSAAAAAASAAAVAAGYQSGLFAARPAAPATAVHYYSTDRDSLDVWIPAAARWFTIG